MIFHKKYGSTGPNLVIIHGLFGNSDNWHSIAQALSSEFQVYCLDLPNHGRSSPLEEVSYRSMADRILDWADTLQLEHISLLGHSMGGKVAMQVACQAPERVQHLIVADISPVDYPSGHHDILDGLRSIDPTQITDRKQADQQLAEFEPNLGIRRFLLKSLVKEGDQFVWRLHIDNLYRNYGNIRKAPVLPKPYSSPTLFIKGELSNYIQAEHRETILTWFPKAQVKIIPGTGHWLHAEKPLPFTSLVRRFCTTGFRA